ncbi:MAG: DUF6089 family protein [Bacteroidetes bacterium]|nr:DUF6089 family protein [Bacteroidota bacterium]
MKKHYYILIVLLHYCCQSFAQEKRGMIGFGISAGAVNYAGELDDNFTLQFTRLGVGVHATALFFSRMHARLAYFHGQIGAHDGGLFSADNRRNLDFYSDIDEASFVLMYKFQNRKRGFTKRNFATPYLFAGIAGFMFNPKTNYNGKTYELQKVGTEGQNLGGNYAKPYNLQQWSIPFGVGFMLKVTQKIDFGGECGFRKTFTDYLDDISTYYPDKEQLRAKQGDIAVALSDRSADPSLHSRVRGNPTNKDWYVYTNLHITYYFTTTLFKPYKLKNQFKDNTCKHLMTPKKL